MKLRKAQTGYGALVLVVIVLVILFIVGDLDFSIPPQEEKNETLPSCGFCVNDCQARLAQSEARCRQHCQRGIDCEEMIR